MPNDADLQAVVGFTATLTGRRPAVSEETVHVTSIEKIGQDGVNAMHITGVVNGRQVEGLVGMEAFVGKEKQGEKALHEFLKDGLSALHEAQQEQRR